MTRARSVATRCLKNVQLVHAVTCAAVARIVVPRARAVGRRHLQQLVSNVGTSPRRDHLPHEVLVQEKSIIYRWCREPRQTPWQDAIKNDTILTCRRNQ